MKAEVKELLEAEASLDQALAEAQRTPAPELLTDAEYATFSEAWSNVQRLRQWVHVLRRRNERL